MAPSIGERSALSPGVAASACVLYALLYVGSVYISRIIRPRPGLDRNHPFVIQARVRAATVVTLICVFGTSATLYFKAGSTWWDTLAFMGIAHITPKTGVDILRSLLLTAVLFAGPLFERALSGDISKDGGFASGRMTWVGWRNYVVAPLTEEIAFRACMVPLGLIAGVSPTKIVFLTPLVFGIAHFHHAYEFLLTYPGYFKLAAVSSIAQFTYTTMFGWYAVFILLRSGSVWPAVAVHTFCNWMGVPSVTIGGPKWRSFVYYALLLGGMWAFYKLFWPLTESANALAAFT